MSDHEKELEAFSKQAGGVVVLSRCGCMYDPMTGMSQSGRCRD